MSIRDHIASLEELSALDAEIRHLDEQLNTDRESLAGLKQEVERLNERITADTATIAEMVHTRAEQSQEARQLLNQIEKSREKLTRARNEREQNAASRELEELRRLHKDREEEIGKLAILEAQAQKSKEEAEAERAKVIDELASIEAATSGRLAEVEKTRDERAAVRKDVAAKIPKPVLRRYDTIRRRKGVAIAATHDGTCLACQMAMPPQMFQRILRGDAMELCPHCQRILYYRAPLPKEES